MSYFVELNDLVSNETYKLVGGEKPIFMIGSFLKNKAQEEGLDVMVVNDANTPKIVKLIDKQKFVYEQKKAKKDQEKKNKASAQKLKEVKFHMNIAEHDIQVKVKQINEFLDKNCKVRIVLELRGREVDMMGMAKDLMNKILTNFEGRKIEPIKIVGSNISTFITR